MSLDPRLARALEDSNTKLGEVERLIIPLVATSRDILAISTPGSGVTNACVYGVINTLCSCPIWPPGTKAVFLFPTREMAYQAYQTISCLKTGHGLLVQLIVSQSDLPESNHPSKNFDVVVGTPGKVLGAVESGSLSLNTVKYYLFDDANSLLGNTGAGFHCRRLCQQIPPEAGVRIVTSSSQVLAAMGRFCLRGSEKRIDITAMGHKQTCVLFEEFPMEKGEHRLQALWRLAHLHLTGKCIMIFASTIEGATSAHKYLSEKFDGGSYGLLTKAIGIKSREDLFRQFQDGSLDAIITCRLFFAGLSFMPTVRTVVFLDPPATDVYAIIGRLRISAADGEIYVIVDPSSQGEKDRMMQIDKKMDALDDLDPSVFDTENVLPSLNSLYSPSCKLIIRGLECGVTLEDLMGWLEPYKPVRGEVHNDKGVV